MKQPEGRAVSRESTVRALTCWARRHDAVSFESVVRYLSGHGLQSAAAHDVVRVALDRRLLIARTPVGEICNDTMLIPAALRRGETTERDITRTIGTCDHRWRDPSGGTTCIWILAVGTHEPPSGRRIAPHAERDRCVALDFGRHHVPFATLVLGERLLLRCRFGHDGYLRSHRVEVR